MIEIIPGDALTTEMKSMVHIAKTDRGGFNFETRERNTILSHLVIGGFIDDWQEDYVWTFLELRHAWLLKSNFKTNALYRRGVEFFATPDRAAEFYDLVCHKIGKTVKVIILTIDSNRPMSIEEIDIYRVSIDKLTHGMDLVKKELAERIQNA